MYLTAQRVESEAGDGINTFLYEHGGAVESPPPAPVKGCLGKLITDLIMVPPGGNKVTSYLDIVCDDGMPWSEIDKALKVFVLKNAALVPGPAFPWCGTTDDFRFELAMVSRLARPGHAWIKEASILSNACKMVYAQQLIAGRKE
jgi:hypothetical protein